MINHYLYLLNKPVVLYSFLDKVAVAALLALLVITGLSIALLVQRIRVILGHTKPPFDNGKRK